MTDKKLSVFRFGFFTPHFYLHMLLMKVGVIRKALFKLGEIVPSQCSDLQLLLRRALISKIWN